MNTDSGAWHWLSSRRPLVTVVVFFLCICERSTEPSDRLLAHVLINVLYMSVFSILVFFSAGRAGKDQSGHSCVFRQKEQQPGAFCSDYSDFYLPLPIQKDHAELTCLLQSRASHIPVQSANARIYSMNSTHTHTHMFTEQHKDACTQRALCISPHHEYRQ